MSAIGARRAFAVAAVVMCAAAAAFSAARAQRPELPTPESVLGFKVGADFKLATYDESIRYFQRLAASSDRIKRDLGWAPVGQPPLDAVYYEFELDGLVITRRPGYRPDADADSPDTGRPDVADT